MTDSERFAEFAEGTCQPAFQICSTLEIEEDGLDWEVIENITFNCTTCGWWCAAGDFNDEVCEATGEQVCSECDE